MGAASYIGRIGGLAVALGVGTAIITGQGVANATPSTGGEDSQTESAERRRTENQTTGTANRTATPAGSARSSVKHSPTCPTSSDAIGPIATTPTSATATSIVKRLSDAAEETAKRVSDALRNAAGAVDGDDAAARTASRSSGSSSLSDRLAARAERVAAGAPSPEHLTDRERRHSRRTTLSRTNSSTGHRPSRTGWRRRASRPDGPSTLRRPFPPRHRCGLRSGFSPRRWPR